MSRYARKKEPPVKPVKKIEVSDSHRKLKLILIVALLALGVTLIATAAISLIRTEPGWETIQPNVSAEESCAGEFVFLYLLGDGDQAANVEQRQVTDVYTRATKSAFEIFHAQQEFVGVYNVAYLNRHPNEEVEVPEVLYRAFTLFEAYENRGLYLAPLYREYVGMFLCSEDYTAEVYDPAKSAEQAQYFTEVLSFVTDENAVKLELLGDNRVKLHVSEEYLQYAAAKEITEYVDFYWMKNAFIVDYLAQQVAEAGFTKGSISSYDGYVRNLDTADRSYMMNIFDRVEENIYRAARLEYSQVGAFVTLRNYPNSSLDVDRYYQWSDGRITSCFIDPTDGKDRTAVNDLMGYSKTVGCGELLLKLYPVYISESLQEEALERLHEQGVESVYVKDCMVYATEEGAKISDLYQTDTIRYQLG